MVTRHVLSVAGVPRMGEWSPECAAVEWEDAHMGPVAGARFVGHNRTGPRKLIRWSRPGRVLVADRVRLRHRRRGPRGRRLALPLLAVDVGTRVTESCEVTRLPAWARILDVPTNRYGDLQRNMRRTLEQLKTSVEAALDVDHWR